MIIENGRIVGLTPEEKSALQAERDKTFVQLDAANAQENQHDVDYCRGAESVLSWLIRVPVVNADTVRVLRIVEYKGPRAWVEETVARALHGTKMDVGPHGASITAVTLGEYPEPTGD